MLLATSVILAGCATAPHDTTPPLTVESGAAAYAARSLQDPELRRFLRENLGREPDRWDFETLCWVGFYYQPSLEVARAQWAAARGAEHTAAERPNPSVTVTPGYDFTREAGISPWMPAVSFDWLFPNRSARQRQIDVVAGEAEAARLNILVAAWDMRSELRQALIDANIAARRLSALEAQQEAQRQLFQLLQQRFEAGSIAATEVSTARSTILRAEAAVADANRQSLQARSRVAAALGVPLSAIAGIALPPPPLVPRFSPEELPVVRQRALQSRADVLAALAKYQAAHAALELEFAKRFPDVHLGPAYQWDQGQNKWSLGITVELPVFNRHEGAIAAALGRRAEAVAQFNAVQNKAVATIDSAVVSLELARAQTERIGRLRAEAEQQLAAARAQLEAGAVDQVQTQTARLDLTAAETAVLDAEAAVETSAGQLEDALQIPFANIAGLVAPARTAP